MKKITIFLFVVSLVFACQKFTGAAVEPMPQEPDYTLSQAWYTNVEGSAEAAIDVFYILPTCLFSWSDTTTGELYRYADIYSQEQRAAQLYSYDLANQIFGENTNFYAPYYRQITLDVWMEGESAVERLFPAAMADIEAAFNNFIETKNSNRPFILAGFSQGAKGVVELVKGLSDGERKRMVAAYVIGYKVTENDLKSENIVAASSSDDLGVTICYNSVATVEAINPMIADSKICINPVNWSIVDVPVVVNDSVEITLNKEYNVLIVEGLDSEALYIAELKELFDVGNYHLQELELYGDALRDNVADRIAAYMGAVEPPLD